MLAVQVLLLVLHVMLELILIQKVLRRVPTVRLEPKTLIVKLLVHPLVHRVLLENTLTLAQQHVHLVLLELIPVQQVLHHVHLVLLELIQALQEQLVHRHVHNVLQEHLQVL